MIEPTAQENIGLLYLVSSLRTKGWAVSYINLANIPIDRALEYLPDSKLYGFTSTYVDYDSVKSMSKFLLQNGKKTILGGPYATACYSLIERNTFSSILVGEGDLTIHKVLIDNANNKLKPYYQGEQVEYLDSLPFPSREDGIKGGKIFLDGTESDNVGTTNIITSRGCNYSCCFCGSNSIWGKKVRYRSISNVVKEIEHCLSNLNVNKFRFSDDNLTNNMGRVEELCKGIVILSKKYNTPIFWRISSRVVPSSYEQWKIMRIAGCIEVGFGIESFDQRVLDALGKKTSVNQNIKAVKDASRAGIKVRLLLMINTPGESADTAKINIDILKKLQFNEISCKVFIPSPGTDVWTNPQKYGLIIQNKRILDSTTLNFWEWTKDKNGKVIKNKTEPIHIICGIKQSEMRNNRELMRDYIINNGYLTNLDMN
jgi:radical SAM superfamily enzyme YgiQ (UPF0313 family)